MICIAVGIIILLFMPMSALSQNKPEEGVKYPNNCEVIIHKSSNIPDNVIDFLIFTWYEVVKHYYWGCPNSPVSSFSFIEDIYSSDNAKAIEFLKQEKNEISFACADSSFSLLYTRDTIISWKDCMKCDNLSGIDYSTLNFNIVGYDYDTIAVDSSRIQLMNAYYDTIMPRIYLHCYDYYGYDIVLTDYHDLVLGTIKRPKKLLVNYCADSGIYLHPLCHGHAETLNNDFYQELVSFAQDVCNEFKVPKITFIVCQMERAEKN